MDLHFVRAAAQSDDKQVNLFDDVMCKNEFTLFDRENRIVSARFVTILSS